MPTEALQAGVDEARLSDVPALAWWTIRKLRSNPALRLLSCLFFATVALGFVDEGIRFQWDGRAYWLALAELSVMVLVVAISLTVRWSLLILRTDSRVYLDARRGAAIALTPSRGGWGLAAYVTNHSPASRLRPSGASPLATSAISLSADPRVQELYLRQFASWGLRTHLRPTKNAGDSLRKPSYRAI